MRSEDSILPLRLRHTRNPGRAPQTWKEVRGCISGDICGFGPFGRLKRRRSTSTNSSERAKANGRRGLLWLALSSSSPSSDCSCSRSLWLSHISCPEGAGGGPLEGGKGSLDSPVPLRETNRGARE